MLHTADPSTRTVALIVSRSPPKVQITYLVQAQYMSLNIVTSGGWIRTL